MEARNAFGPVKRAWTKTRSWGPNVNEKIHLDTAFPLTGRAHQDCKVAIDGSESSHSSSEIHRA